MKIKFKYDYDVKIKTTCGFSGFWHHDLIRASRGQVVDYEELYPSKMCSRMGNVVIAVANPQRSNIRTIGVPMVDVMIDVPNDIFEIIE